MRDVLSRPRIARKHHISRAIADEFVSRLRRRAVLVPVTHTLQLCRDPSDDIVIETAALGQANALVTRDDDIKDDSELKGILSAADIQVLSVRHFLAELEFLVNYQELHPPGRRPVNYNLSTREQTYRGTIRDVKVVVEQPGRAVLWLYIDVFDYDGEEVEIIQDKLWLPADSGKVMDFINDLHQVGIDLATPHDLVGQEFTLEYKHGYSTEFGGQLRIPQ